MIAVRYFTLAALVVWLGGMVALWLPASPTADAMRQFHLVGYGCGAVILVGLLVLKFVGPPPRGFIPRVALVTVMLGLAVYVDTWSQTPSALLRTFEIALGFVLLFWYARE